MDVRKEANSIPETTHLYWLSAQDRVGVTPWASCCACGEFLVCLLGSPQLLHVKPAVEGQLPYREPSAAACQRPQEGFAPFYDVMTVAAVSFSAGRSAALHLMRADMPCLCHCRCARRLLSSMTLALSIAFQPISLLN